MLRAKQITNLSQCARSFYLSGPRCSTPDGAPCTSSEDENHTLRSQCKSSEVIHKQNKPRVLSASIANSGTSTLRNAIGSTIQLSSKASSSSSSCQIHHPTSSLGSDVNTVNEKVSPTRSTDLVSDKDYFVSAAENLLNCGGTKVVKHNVTDSHTSAVESRQPAIIAKSTYEKPRSRGKCSKDQTSSSANAAWSSDSASGVHNDTIAGGEKSSTLRARQGYNSANAKAPKTQSKLSKTHGKQIDTRKEMFNADGFFRVTKSTERTANENGIFGAAESHVSAHKFLEPVKSSRFLPMVLQSAKHTMNPLLAIEQYYHTLQQQKWGPFAEACLDNLDHKLDAFQANQVLKLLRDHSVALGFFNWLKRQPRFKHDDYTYTTMIGILGRARQFDSMKELLREMIRDGCLPTVVTYNRIIHAYGRANFIGEAVKVFHEMQEFGYEPDLVTYCTLIDIHAKAGFLDVALGLYHKMRSVGLSPDTFTYSVMVNCLGKGGQLAAAQKMYLEMIKNGCVPNLVTYNIMIALQSKARNYASAVKLYRDMQVAGYRPDQVTYNIVMEALGHCGYIEEAEAVFTEMKRDCVPDEPVYGLLIDLWGKAGNVERAHSWYCAMIDVGLKPNTPTCNSLLSGYLRAHRFSEAREVLVNMIWMGLVPSSQTYTILLSCCTESKMQMFLCCELMAITGHPAHSFLLSLPNAEPSGQNVREHTSRFFDLMHSEDRESKRGLVDAVVDFLYKTGLKEEAGFVWEVAAQRNIYPDSVKEKSKSHWLINLHVMSDGTAVTALSRTLAWFQRRIMDCGLRPGRIDIITGWGRRSRITGSSMVRFAVEELLQLFQFPFTANSNSGCFVGCGEPLNQWLLNSYVQRMHLL